MTRRSVRFRVTGLAAIVVAIGLLVAGGALVVLQRNVLTSGLDQTLTQRANDIEALVTDGLTPDPFLSSAGEGFVQIVDPAGSVIASTPNLAGDSAVTVRVSGVGQDVIENYSDLAIDDDVFRVLGRQISDESVLVVGTTYDTVGESTSALLASMAVVIPILVLGLSLLIWWLVGRTLQPVEGIRKEVAEIGASDLHRRVPEPGTEDEIDRLAETMNGMLERIEMSIGRQQRFVADASHELRSPLTRLRTQLEIDRAGNLEVPGHELKDSLLSEVLGMQALVEDLLYLARADADATGAAPVALDLDDVVLREVRRVRERGHAEVDIFRVSGAHVIGDPARLGRAVRNLLENAVRHADSTIRLELTESDGSGVLLVSDDGPGIAPEDQNRIFDRFTRMDEARSSETGRAGLGLAIARDIATGHGGSLRLVDTGEPGATFELAIPLAPQDSVSSPDDGFDRR